MSKKIICIEVKKNKSLFENSCKSTKNLCKSKAEHKIYFSAMLRCSQIYLKFVQIESRVPNLFEHYAEMPPNLYKIFLNKNVFLMDYSYICSSMGGNAP